MDTNDFLNIPKIDDPLRIFANRLILDICMELDALDQNKIISEMVDELHCKYGIKLSLCDKDNVGKPYYDDKSKSIYYNKDTEFYQINIAEIIVEKRLKLQEEQLFVISEGIEESTIGNLVEQISRYIGFSSDEYSLEKALLFRDTLQRQEAKRICDAFLYVEYPRLRPLLLGPFLRSFGENLKLINRLQKEDNAPNDLLLARKVSFLTDSYFIQQCFGVVTMWDIMPSDEEIELMHNCYDSILSSGNHPRLYAKKCFDIIGLSRYFSFDIALNRKIKEKVVTASNPINPELSQSHGDHWDALMPLKEFMENLSTYIKESKLIAKVETEATFENNKDIFAKISILNYKDDSLDLVLLLGYDKINKVNQFITAFPAFTDGRSYLFQIEKVEEWENHIEAIVTGCIGDFEISFFATDYVSRKDKYQSGNQIIIDLYGVAMEVKHPQEYFELKGQSAIDFLRKIQREPTYNNYGEVEPVKISMSNMVAFIPNRDAIPSEAQFQSPLITLESEELLGHELSLATIVLYRNDKEEDEVTIPIRFRNKTTTPFIQGDPIQGWLWLLGNVSDEDDHRYLVL